MHDNITHTIIRFAIVFVIISLGFVCVLGKIIVLQTKERSRWEQVVDRQRKKNQEILPLRGAILDDSDNALASSVPQYTVYMDTRVEALHLGGDTLFHKYVDSIAIGLSRILGDRSPREYREVMTRAFYAKRNRDRYVRIYPQSINYLQRKQIKQLPLVCRGEYKSGFHFEERHRRNRPFGSFGQRTVGSIYGESGHGNAGLEKSFDAYLCGTPGVATIQRVAGHNEHVPVKEAVEGKDIRTTLNVNLMDICESALRNRLEHTKADWGCCILMETRSGQIKAISNLDRDTAGRYTEKFNHAVTRVEPGSTFKTIALLAALDDGKINLEDTFRVYRKGWDYLNAHHTDSHPRDTVYTVRSALAVSSNIALAKIITDSYEKKASKFVDKLRKMGVCDSLYSEIPGAQSPRIDIPNDGVTLSRMAYGYSVELTPMQILAFYNAIANDGKMIRPYLVSDILEHGRAVKHFETETVKSSLCSRSSLRDIRLALHDVVWDNHLGTASVSPWGQKKAQSDLVHIAGKTGTAQLFYNGRYHRDAHRITFVGFFPEENPQYTCLCMMEHPRGAYDAGMDCGIVVRQIAEKTMVYAGYYRIKDGELIYEIK